MKVKTANLWIGGEEVPVEKNQAMLEPINGFVIRGGDNSGKCYATKKAIKAMQGGDIVGDLEDA